MKLTDLVTPVALIDLPRMQHNIERMQAKVASLGATFRPHVKTSKCVQATEAQIQAGAQGITVSTIKEAEQFFAAGIRDILYAVGLAPNKLAAAGALMRKGCDLKVLTDSVQSAQAMSDFAKAQGLSFKVLIEIDTDDHRSGIKPESAALLAVAQALESPGCQVVGVMTHAGSSYDLNTPEALIAMAEQERAGCVRAAERLREEFEARKLPWPLLVQGEMGRTELLAQFRAAGNAVLIGSQSFWEGVDVRGDALSVVIIDKLPFAPPDDPVLSARIEHMKREGRNAFMDYQLPHAVISMKQGAGRLIRDESDRGVLMICDPRLISKPYGKRIWQSLPPFARTRELGEVQAFLQGGANVPPE
mgnify:CR=1 FL=1